ncbi:MAG: GlsB/YeaQ/YmgE family stress response membrane protein [Candidatus Saccharibacteria bacterium]
MNFIAWIIFGAIAGWIASIIMRTDGEQGAFMNIVIGIVGAMLGGFIMSKLGNNGVTGFNIYSLIVAIVGSIILIAIVKAFRRRT